MPKIKYQDFKFKSETLTRIQQANDIIAEYAAHGYDLTLRQLYYQFVARGLIPNNDKEYNKLGDVIANGRLAGLIDWSAITDRTRNVRGNTHWSSPQAIIRACAEQFQIDKWADQPFYVEVWVEKDALIGVLEPVCDRLDVPYYACRGYNSASEIWNAAHNRIKGRLEKGKKVRVFYLGDHDPSGIDMTRDVGERLALFTGWPLGQRLSVKRLALNMDQVEEHQPPENPTKMTDSRAKDYVEEYGESCWELDALDPNVISTIIETAVLAVRHEGIWELDVDREEQYQKRLQRIADNWSEVTQTLDSLLEEADRDEEDGEGEVE